MDFVLAQFAAFGSSLAVLAIDPITYPYLICSVALGIVFGALPGLTATLAVTILTGIMVIVGLIAYGMIRMEFPIAPLLIGVILGPLLDETFRRALLVSDGDLSVFVTRPGAAILLGLNVALVLSRLPPVRRGISRLFGGHDRSTKAEG